jgi:hypothetical protein
MMVAGGLDGEKLMFLGYPYPVDGHDQSVVHRQLQVTCLYTRPLVVLGRQQDMHAMCKLCACMAAGYDCVHLPLWISSADENICLLHLSLFLT